MKKSLFLFTALISLGAMPAAAQVPSMATAEYSGQMKISSDGGQDQYAYIYKTPTKQRMEMNVGQQGDMVTIMDMTQRTGISYSKDPNGPMGTMAISVDYNQFMDQMGTPDPAEISQMSPIGSSSVAGHACNIYQHTDGTTACITNDGIMMNAISGNGRIEMVSLNRGPQASSLFVAPADRQVMDMGNVFGSIGAGGFGQTGSTGYGSGGYETPGTTPTQQSETPSQLQRRLEYEAQSKARREADDQVREQVGNNVGGRILGDTVGGEAGKAASGIVGGLFGKKKKKKKDKDKD